MQAATKKGNIEISVDWEGDRYSVHGFIDDNEIVNKSLGFVISHKASGLKFPLVFDSKAKAIALADLMDDDPRLLDAETLEFDGNKPDNKEVFEQVSQVWTKYYRVILIGRENSA